MMPDASRTSYYTQTQNRAHFPCSVAVVAVVVVVWNGKSRFPTENNMLLRSCGAHIVRSSHSSSISILHIAHFIHRMVPYKFSVGCRPRTTNVVYFLTSLFFNSFFLDFELCPFLQNAQNIKDTTKSTHTQKKRDTFSHPTSFWTQLISQRVCRYRALPKYSENGTRKKKFKKKKNFKQVRQERIFAARCILCVRAFLRISKFFVVLSCARVHVSVWFTCCTEHKKVAKKKIKNKKKIK